MKKLKDIFRRQSKNETPVDAVKKGFEDAEQSSPHLRAQANIKAALDFADASGLMEGLKALEEASKNGQRPLHVAEYNFPGQDYLLIELENLPSIAATKSARPGDQKLEKDRYDQDTLITVTKRKGLFSEYFQIATTTDKASREILCWEPAPLREKDSCNKTLRYLARRAREEGLFPKQ